MTENTWIRVQLAVLIYGMTNAVLFGAGIILVLAVPMLSANAGLWIPLIVAVSFVVAAPIAWEIAPRLRARYGRARSQRI
jgi:hypothetical protein